MKSIETHKALGISDPSKFYYERFFTGGVLDARYFDAVDRFSMRFARTMWIYNNVRRGSSVLDLGCGEGQLALLRRKGVYLAGVDISRELIEIARRNGYDATCIASLSSLPFPDRSFDYVVSLDVLGHIAPEEKPEALREIKRVLRPGGVTLHGIECFNPRLHPLPGSENYREFVQIDGHIGLEEEGTIAARFQNAFAHVQWEPRYTLCLSCEEIIKQAERYGMPFDEDLLLYLRSLSYKERRAFDLAMGYVFNKISELGMKLPSSGLYILLKASDSPLGPFYNEHQDDRFDLAEHISKPSFCLDRHGAAFFDAGWYGANYLPPVARWMGERATIRFEANNLSRIRMDLTTHIPDLNRQPLELHFKLNGESICSFSLHRYGWLELELEVPASAAENRPGTQHELEIRANRTWRPSDYASVSDDRELSIAVCNIEVFSEFEDR